MHLQKTYKQIKDIPEEYKLVTNSQNIKPVLDHIGKLDIIDEVGLLFVKTSNENYDSVYYSESSVPYVDSLVWELK